MKERNIINRALTKALIIKGNMAVKDLFKNAEDSRTVNEKTLYSILKLNKNSEYGKKYDFANIRSVEEFQKKVPIITYKDIDEYIDRMYYDNEQNVLTSEKLIGYSSTSGSLGKPKMIPLTDKQIHVYTKYTITRALALANEYNDRLGREKITHGYGIPLLDLFYGESPHGIPKTNVVDVSARKYGALYKYILNLPLGGLFRVGDVEPNYSRARFGLENRDAIYIFSVFSNSVDAFIQYIKNNWEMLVDDIEKGVINESVYFADDVRERLKQKVKPNPKRAAELRKEFEKGFDETIISRIWPNMRFVYMIGTSPSFEPYVKEIEKYIKGILIDYSVYAASEGLFAVAYECGNSGQLMLPDSSFYEFIEQTENPDETKLLLIDQLEEGKKYEIIITTFSGLYRYKFNDVVSVVGHVGTCPVIEFSHRKGQLVNVVSEKTSLEQMMGAVELFEAKTGLKVKAWTISCPQAGPGGYYLAYFEGDEGVDFAQYSREMDEAFCKMNSRYAEFRESKLISPAVVKTQTPGTHAAWRQKKLDAGVAPSQIKPVTILDTDEKKEFFGSRVL